MRTRTIDCLVIGTGIAGCATAYALAKKGKHVVMISRAEKREKSATAWAQGGIIYKSKGTEDPESLIQDIERAGAGLSFKPAAQILADEGPQRVNEILIEQLEVPFDRKDSGEWRLTSEGAHSHPRILHVEDHTGKEIERFFLAFLSKQANVEILTQRTAIDLITLAHHSEDLADRYEAGRCLGAYIYNQKEGLVETILAKETVLATGGLGCLFLHTTNPSGARGDGLAMAYRTGARIMNLEYVQFHPTALFLRKSSKRFLISEAVRGEGGILLNHDGHPFMENYDERKELAPRDIVARAIHDELLRTNSEFVLLDISHKPSDWIRARFPKIHRECLDHGVDITQEPIPVVPAAHYSCGGVWTNLEGQTTIQNLWAVGEVACNGLHGANRLASTSLLDGLVFGVRAGEGIVRSLSKETYAFPKIRPWESKKERVDMDLLFQDWLTIKHTMWNYVGLVRTKKRLERAQRILRGLSEEVRRFYANSSLSDELIGLRNGSLTAQLILTAAQRNHSNRGCHSLGSD